MRKKACKRCAGEHDVKECNSSELKCVNCVYANEKLNIGVDTSHATFSKKCTVLNIKFNVERKKVFYNQDS